MEAPLHDLEDDLRRLPESNGPLSLVFLTEAADRRLILHL